MADDFSNFGTAVAVQKDKDSEHFGEAVPLETAPAPALVAKPAPKPTFTQKYIEPYLVPAGTIVGGILGSVEPGGGNVVGAGLGAAAGEATKQGIERRQGRQQGTDIPAMVEAVASGTAAEMGSQILGKGLEAGMGVLSRGAGILSKGIDAAKDYYSIGEKAIKWPGLEFSDEAPVPKQLTRGALITPPPEDASGTVAGPRPRAAEGTRATRLGLLLPAGREPLITPPPADTLGTPIPRAAESSEGPARAPAGPSRAPSTRALLNRLGDQIEDVAKYPAIQPTARYVPGRSIAAKGILDAPEDLVAGSNPIPLKDQSEPPARTPAPIKDDAVMHPMDRQVVHVNGQEVLDKLRANPELRDDVMNLEGEQLRELLRKSGEDMTNIKSVGKSPGKAARGGRIADPENISREEAFQRLFKKGYSLGQIVKEAPGRIKPVPVRAPFGPPRVP